MYKHWDVHRDFRLPIQDHVVFVCWYPTEDLFLYRYRTSMRSTLLWKPYVRENEPYHCFHPFQIDYRHRSILQPYMWEDHNLLMRHVNHFWSMLLEFLEHSEELFEIGSMDLFEEQWLRYETKREFIIGIRWRKKWIYWRTSSESTSSMSKSTK